MDVDCESVEIPRPTAATGVTSSSDVAQSNVAQSSSTSNSAPAAVRQRREIKLTSVMQLRTDVESNMHAGKSVAPSAVAIFKEYVK